MSEETVPTADTAPAAEIAAAPATLLTDPAAPALPVEAPPPTPADYAALAVPQDVATHATGLDDFRAFAAENAIAPDLAQKLVDFQAGLMRDATATHARTVADWERAARTDTEIGGVGFDVHLGAAKRALTSFASPAFTDLLNQSGLGNHPEVIRTLARVGRAMAEDGRVAGAQPAAANPLAALYPTMIKE